jgi:hypothetical protein
MEWRETRMACEANSSATAGAAPAHCLKPVRRRRSGTQAGSEIGRSSIEAALRDQLRLISLGSTLGALTTVIRQTRSNVAEG